MSWREQKCRINLPENVIKQAPDYDPRQPIDRDFEERLYGYYGRPGYWDMDSDLSRERRAG